MKVKFVLSLVMVALFSLMAMGQERQVGISFEFPVKRNLTTSDIALGGKAYLPVGERIVVEGNMSYRNALLTLLNPTDQVDVAGMGRVYLSTTGNTRPFIAGGINHTMPIENPDFTQGRVEVGFNYKNRVVPIVSFTSDALQSGATVLGRDVGGRVEVFIPVGSVNAQVTPFIRRREIGGSYFTEVGAGFGFNLKF